jgi:hypothetical protein
MRDARGIIRRGGSARAYTRHDLTSIAAADMLTMKSAYVRSPPEDTSPPRLEVTADEVSAKLADSCGFGRFRLNRWG